MKVLLVNAPWYVDGKPGVRAGSRWPYSSGGGYYPYPHFLGYATSYLTGNGVDARFLDAIALRMSYAKFYSDLKTLNPDIVVFETSTPTINHDYELVKGIRWRTDAEIVLVGTHATTFAEEWFQMPGIDYVVKGDYEKQLLEICRTRKRGVYDYDPIEDLGELPFPYMDGHYVSRYCDTIGYKVAPVVKFPQLQIYPSRGCHKRCKFCLWTSVMYKNKVRYMDVGRVLDEIESRVSRYGIKDVFIDSDSFGYGGPVWITEFAEGMKKIGVQYSIMTTEGLIERDLFRLLKESGCYAVRIGVETFSQRLYDTINKGGKVEDVESLMKYLLDLGFWVHFTMVQHLAGETDEDRTISQKKTYMFTSRPRCDHQDSVCVPFPGTPYYDELIARGLEIGDWSVYDANPNAPETVAFWDKIRRITNGL